MKKQVLYVCGLSLLIVFAILYFIFGPTGRHENFLLKCPDDYANTDEGSAGYLADFDKWTNDFYDRNPSASISDWSAARVQYWRDNDCEKALARYRDAQEGKADPEAMDQIDESINRLLENNK